MQTTSGKSGFAALLCVSLFVACRNSDKNHPASLTNDTLALKKMPPEVQYGRDLIAHTARYLGPRGTVHQATNGMNCQNCHLEAGMRPFANPLTLVASTYPRYRSRSGRIETIEFRINECLRRSLNGEAIDSNGREMKAMKAYLLWIGEEKQKKPANDSAHKTASTIPLLDRPADTTAGRQIYVKYCTSCHGQYGGGQLFSDSSEYQFPPLWGEHSFNISAGMYRIEKLAVFIYSNMPLGASYDKPLLSAEQAWDVAAYVASTRRPVKWFKYDWPKVGTKPYDYPFPPFADTFSAAQHKYGPFKAMKKSKTPA